MQLFDQLQQIYESSANPEIQERSLRLLAYFENPQLAERALHFAVSSHVRNQDSAIQLAIALEGNKTRDLAWQFIRTNWDKVQTELTPEMGQILVGSTGSFCSDSARNQVEQFFAEHKVGVATVALRHAVEHINGCVEFRALQQPKLQSWIASKSASQPGS
jgi:ERAP1-like C-terminal domain